MISTTWSIPLLTSAVVKFQLKLRLKTVTLYRVKHVRIVFPSATLFVETNIIRQE